MCDMSVEIFDCLKCELDIYIENHNTQLKYGLQVYPYQELHVLFS